MNVAITVAYLLITLTSIGLLSEMNPWGSYMEFFRCLAFLLLSSQQQPQDYFLQGALKLYFFPSMILWFVYILQQRLIKSKAVMKNKRCDEGHWDPCIIPGDKPAERNGTKIFNWGNVKSCGGNKHLLVESKSALFSEKSE